MIKVLFVIFIMIFAESLTLLFDETQASGDRKGTLNQLPSDSPNEPYKLYFKIPDTNQNDHTNRR
ncbi:MAG: hypothetical protein H0X26_09185 [Alphaproteobacteria bacterium]|nr:hypothetical protein [Alphaproteobacteria bacterium]